MTRPIHEIARAVLTYARSWEPAAKLLGNATAAEVERLSATIADPWRPIEKCGELERGEYVVWCVHVPDHDGAEPEEEARFAYWSGDGWSIEGTLESGAWPDIGDITHVHQMGPIRGPGETT